EDVGGRSDAPGRPIPVLGERVAAGTVRVVPHGPYIVRPHRAQPGQLVAVRASVWTWHDGPLSTDPVFDEGVPSRRVDEAPRRPGFPRRQGRHGIQFASRPGGIRTGYDVVGGPIPVQGQRVSLA